MTQPEDCTTPAYHKTHNYCPSCNWRNPEVIADPKSSRIKELEETVAKLEEALTPSGNTKAVYSGEFEFSIEESCGCNLHEHECPDCQGEGTISRKVMIPWTNIKDIMKAIYNRADISDNPLKEIREELQEYWETVLLEHSYEHVLNSGWWGHSCMSDQEEALTKLIDADVFETHPEWPAIFRPKDKEHWFFLNTREARGRAIIPKEKED